VPFAQIWRSGADGANFCAGGAPNAVT